jgi:5'-nucleotidase
MGMYRPRPKTCLKGLKVCRQAYAKYEERFDERNDPNRAKILLADSEKFQEF